MRCKKRAVAHAVKIERVCKPNAGACGPDVVDEQRGGRDHRYVVNSAVNVGHLGAALAFGDTRGRCWSRAQGQQVIANTAAMQYPRLATHTTMFTL